MPVRLGKHKQGRRAVAIRIGDFLYRQQSGFLCANPLVQISARKKKEGPRCSAQAPHVHEAGWGQAAGIWEIRANAGMSKEEMTRQKASTGVEMRPTKETCIHAAAAAGRLAVKAVGVAL